MKKLLFLLAICFSAILLFRFIWTSPGEVKNASPLGENIICFGDSLTFGTGAAKGMDYPSQLSRKISFPIINKGVPGDTTKRALERLDRDVLSLSPRIVLITLGGNDLKNGVARDVAFKNLKAIVESIQAKGALVIVGGIDIPFWDRGFAEGYSELCRETGAVLVPNIFSGIFGDSKLMSDSIHPNDAGYGKMAEKFYEALKPYIPDGAA